MADLTEKALEDALVSLHGMPIVSRPQWVSFVPSYCLPAGLKEWRIRKYGDRDLTFDEIHTSYREFQQLPVQEEGPW